MKQNIYIFLMVVVYFLWIGNSKAQTVNTQSQKPIKAFVNVNVLTMNDSIPLKGQTVLIKNDKIIKIGASQQVKVPASAQIIDGRHTQYLIPGLTDTHVHLSHKGAEEWVRAFVNSGVTTVFNLGGFPKVLKIRRDIKADKIIGPDIYTTGYPGVVRKLKRKGFKKVSLKKIERRILQDKQQGYDMIKTYGRMTKVQYAHLMKVARREGIHVTGHIPRNLSSDDALQMGQKSFAHTEEFIYTQFTSFDEQEVMKFAQKAGKQKIWLIANMIAYQKILETWGKPQVMDSILGLPETQRLHPAIRRLYTKDWYGSRDVNSRNYIKKVYAFYVPVIKHFYRAGVKILVGTDTAFPLTPPGESVIDEIKNLTTAGLSPYEALKAATANPGEYIKLFVNKAANFGKVKQNYTAHLVLLDSNPLENLDALRKPAGVLLRGHWYNKTALKKMVQWD